MFVSRAFGTEFGQSLSEVLCGYPVRSRNRARWEATHGKKCTVHKSFKKPVAEEGQ